MSAAATAPLTAEAAAAPVLEMADHPLHPFIFVGCWNTVGTPRNKVADAINRTGITNLILGGDNVYPLEGTKSHSIDVFHEGMRLFEGKRIYGALGNHNVKEAPMKAAQMAYPNWILPSTYYARQFTDGHVLVVLDSNLVTEPEQLAEMESWFSGVVAACRASGLNYYVVQHDPYGSYKKKKYPALKEGSRLLEIMASYQPVAVLCADTHNFQIDTIDVRGKKITQYVVGTGGADYDPIDCDTSIPIKLTDDGIQVTFETHKPGYGFLVVTPGSLEFVKAWDWGAAGGRRVLRKRSNRRRRSGARKTRRSRHAK